jgi:hypothetical protein
VAAHEGIFVDGHRVDSVVLGCLRDPGPHADGLEELPNQVFELSQRHLNEIRAAIQTSDSVHLEFPSYAAVASQVRWLPGIWLWGR